MIHMIDLLLSHTCFCIIGVGFLSVYILHTLYYDGVVDPLQLVQPNCRPPIGVFLFVGKC